ncbi:flagellar biosynthesis anti-sigma factor FlgM [Desulfocurvus sp. DL9XJH121]
MSINGVGNGKSAYDELRIRQQKELEADGQNAKGVNGSADTGDNISVSEDARLLATAMKAAQEAPDIREDEVARLKEQVDAGTYNANGRTIAEKLIAEELDLFQ